MVCTGAPDGVEQYDEEEPFIQVSWWLGNPKHLDPGDGGRSHAVWCRGEPLKKEPESWFFLLPDHGIAVRLVHGTCISWDGREVAHCTSIPSGAQPGDQLYSCFFGVKEDLRLARRRLLELQWAMECREGTVFAAGDEVWVQWPYHGRGGNTGIRCRRRLGKVLQVDGEVSLILAFYHGKDENKRYTYQQDDRNVCIAGRVGCYNPSIDNAQNLLQKRVAVYDRDVDYCVNAIVVSFDAQSMEHTLHVDHSGMVWTGKLGGWDAPYVKVL